MTSTLRSWTIAVLAAAFVAASGGLALGQDPAPPKDDGLESLLKKLEDPKPEATRPAPKVVEQNEAKPKDDAKPKKVKPLAPKDEALDGFLEKLGATTDKPQAEDASPPPGGGGKPPEDTPPGDPTKKRDTLSGEDKEIDDHLIDLTGKQNPNTKKKPQQKGGGQSGPLDKVIEEMRDVEERLGQPDTGEGTRQKQAEIVKNLETLIEQMNQAQNQSQAMKQLRQGKKPGQQQPGPGQQQPGAQANGTPPAKPSAPRGQSPVALDKDAWGHLPAQLREEMGNVFKEGPLPNKLELIRQYYLSLSKKTASREE